MLKILADIRIKFHIKYKDQIIFSSSAKTNLPAKGHSSIQRTQLVLFLRLYNIRHYVRNDRESTSRNNDYRCGSSPLSIWIAAGRTFFLIFLVFPEPPPPPCSPYVWKMRCDVPPYTPNNKFIARPRQVSTPSARLRDTAAFPVRDMESRRRKYLLSTGEYLWDSCLRPYKSSCTAKSKK